MPKQNKEKKEYAPSIPFFTNGNGVKSIIVSEALYDTILENLKVGQILYLNNYEPKDKLPTDRVVFGPQLDSLPKGGKGGKPKKEEDAAEEGSEKVPF